jgi:hypothetical protein
MPRSRVSNGDDFPVASPRRRRSTPPSGTVQAEPASQRISLAVEQRFTAALDALVPHRRRLVAGAVAGQ